MEPPPPPYASINEALQLGVIEKLASTPTAKIDPKSIYVGTPVYLLQELLRWKDKRMSDDLKTEFFTNTAYLAATLYNDTTLGPHLQQFYEKDRWTDYWNKKRSKLHTIFKEDKAAAATWHNNSAIVPVANQGLNTQVGQGWGGGWAGGGSGIPYGPSLRSLMTPMIQPMEVHHHHHYNDNRNMSTTTKNVSKIGTQHVTNEGIGSTAVLQKIEETINKVREEQKEMHDEQLEKHEEQFDAISNFHGEFTDLKEVMTTAKKAYPPSGERYKSTNENLPHDLEYSPLVSRQLYPT